jgi:hypothetical protein
VQRLRVLLTRELGGQDERSNAHCICAFLEADAVPPPATCARATGTPHRHQRPARAKGTAWQADWPI